MQNNQDQTNQPLYRKDLYIITARTNMHVGSGDEAYGLVDNRVQRDVVTQLPNINASGLKGSLREYFSDKYGEDDSRIIEIFGTDSFEKEDKQSSQKHEAGKFRFFNANLLSIPVRSNAIPFFRATSLEVISELISLMETFGYVEDLKIKESLEKLKKLEPEKGQAFIFNTSEKDIVLEDHEYKAINTSFDSEALSILESIFGKNIVLMNHEDFSDICDDFHLPLIARNRLENGRSKNIWHEQVVPRESRFYFFVLKPNSCENDLKFTVGEPVQIGGNASIGYGFTQIKRIEDLFRNPSDISAEK